MRYEGDIAVSELLSRGDVAAFVEQHANAVLTGEPVDPRDIPAGIDPSQALDLVEFVRRMGAGMLVCG